MPEVDATSFVSEGVSECSVLLSGSSSRLEDSSLTVVVTDRNNSGMDSFCSREQIINYLELFFFGKIKCCFGMCYATHSSIQQCIEEGKRYK